VNEENILPYFIILYSSTARLYLTVPFWEKSGLKPNIDANAPPEIFGFS